MKRLIIICFISLMFCGCFPEKPSDTIMIQESSKLHYYENDLDILLKRAADLTKDISDRKLELYRILTAIDYIEKDYSINYIPNYKEDEKINFQIE